MFVTFSVRKESNATKPSREMMWGSNQNRRQKICNRDVLNLRRGTWHSENLIKSPLQCFIFQFEGLRTTNLRHKTQTRFCDFLSVSLFFVSLGKSSVVANWQCDYCLYSRSPTSLICLAWEKYKLSQVLNSNMNFEWLSERKSKWKESHLKTLIELNLIETLTKLLYLFRRSNYVWFRILLLALNI